MTLRELIAHRATTQTDLAAALGVSQAMVSKWVRGERNPKWQTAARIAGALGAVLTIIPAPKDGGWNYIPEEQYEPTQPRTQEEIIADLEGHNEPQEEVE